MSLKRKLLVLALLAAVAAATLVVMSASANNREGHWVTPGVGAVDVYGLESLTHKMEFTLEGVVLPGIVCETSHWDGETLKETSAAVEIIPSFEKCKTTSGSAGEVKIKVNACSLDLYVAKGTVATTEQTADIVCHAGIPMEIIHANCTITISDQKNLTGITYKDLKPPATTDTGVTGTFSVKLAVKADGALCPKGITGGKLSGGLSFEAYDTMAKKYVPIEVT